MPGSPTAAEAAFYREQGYLFPLPVLSEAELAEARANLAATEARIGFAIRHVPPHVHQKDGGKGSATLVRGEDRTGYREHEHAPAADLAADAVAHHAAVLDRQHATLHRGAGGKGTLAATVMQRNEIITSQGRTRRCSDAGPRSPPPPQRRSPRRPACSARA